ncbi:hypothetical protein [Alistipes sp.]|uniref:hypothetical protein n=1 Tax=Alistipes sp. TaxID=1872444 RepID=UPI0025C3D1DB|nr:hypothetical protein [Alistipes sp.]MCI7139864.1 hypothetical protein [Alistipes sp.]MDY5396957.1 hypothetical protein [Alistipes sp.]
MKIETVLYTLALVLATAALGLHAASRLLFPETGTTGSIPVWLLLLCAGTLYGRRAIPEAESERPMNHNQLK